MARLGRHAACSVWPGPGESVIRAPRRAPRRAPHLRAGRTNSPRRLADHRDHRALQLAGVRVPWRAWTDRRTELRASVVVVVIVHPVHPRRLPLGLLSYSTPVRGQGARNCQCASTIVLGNTDYCSWPNSCVRALFLPSRREISGLSVLARCRCADSDVTRDASCSVAGL